MLRLLPPPLFLTSRHSLAAGAFAAPAPQFANQLLADSVTCLDTISPAVVVPVGMHSAISIRNLPLILHV